MNKLRYTDKKENQIFLIYKEIQSGAVAKSYMTNGLLIYGEIFAHFFKFPHILGSPSSIFFFISVVYRFYKWKWLSFEVTVKILSNLQNKWGQVSSSLNLHVFELEKAVSWEEKRCSLLHVSWQTEGKLTVAGSYLLHARHIMVKSSCKFLSSHDSVAMSI